MSSKPGAVREKENRGNIGGERKAPGLDLKWPGKTRGPSRFLISVGKKEKKMKNTGAILLGFLILVAGFFVAPRAEAGADEFGFRNFEEVIRADMRAKHAGMITKVMVLSEKEAQAFWPVFRDYEKDLMKLNDERLRILKEYAQSYETLTEEKANDLAERTLDWQAGRVKPMRDYYKKFSKALSPKTAAKFLQAENQIWLLIDLQVASEVPLVK